MVKRRVRRVECRTSRGRLQSQDSVRALLTEGHDGQLFLETCLLFRVAGTRQAISQLDEAFPFLLPGFDTRLDELNNDSVGARAFAPGIEAHRPPAILRILARHRIAG